MIRRATTLALALYYVLQATWLIHAGMDLLLPPVRTAVAAATGGCCSSACGCPEDARSSRNCCCAKHEALRLVQHAGAPTRAIEEARCKGAQEAMAQAFTQPVISGFAGVEAPPKVSTLTEPLTRTPGSWPLGASIEKVPISNA